MRISELRQDLVSGDWVVVATGRSKRPQAKRKLPSFRQSPERCPFRELADPLVLYALDGKRHGKPHFHPSHPGSRDIWGRDWWVVVVPNKYPAFGEGVCAVFHRNGLYQWTDGVGFHEVLITRDHDRTISEMNDEEVELMVRAYQDRYLALKNDKCVEYVAVFHNQGRLAGATISHPHSQIIAIPVIPPDIGRSLGGSANYFAAKNKCVHCEMLDFEIKAKERLVYENEQFVVFEPYASRTAYETRIFPKRHSAHFEEIRPAERMALANALRTAIAKLTQALDGPDYNFFIHTAPASDAKNFHYYHWHAEILPKTAIWAGFEIGTGIEIATVSPEEAAETLRKIKTD